MQLKLGNVSKELIKYLFIITLIASSQLSVGYAICIAEPGHIEIEYTNSACCNPATPAHGQTDELVEAEAPDCAACVDYGIGNCSLLNRNSHFIMNYSTQQNMASGKFLLTGIARTTQILLCLRVTPDRTQQVHSAMEKSSLPLRC